MKGFTKTLIGFFCLIIMVALTYFAYILPVIFGFSKPSRVLGILGFILSLKISISLASLGGQ